MQHGYHGYHKVRRAKRRVQAGIRRRVGHNGVARAYVTNTDCKQLARRSNLSFIHEETKGEGENHRYIMLAASL